MRSLFKFKKKETKIFCIGLPKTGTTSLTQALDILGYSALHYPDNPIEQARNYDAMSDSPVALHYKELDINYPGARFILTLRDESSWLRSLKEHQSKLPTPKEGTRAYELRLKTLGSPQYNKAKHTKAYKDHLLDVSNYFSGREKDLLIVDFISGSDGWTELCRFLGKDIPSQAFPKANVKSSASLREKAEADLKKQKL